MQFQLRLLPNFHSHTQVQPISVVSLDLTCLHWRGKRLLVGCYSGQWKSL